MKSRDAKSQSANDRDQFTAMTELFENDPVDLVEKLEAFPKYASRQAIAKFLTKYELFQKMLPVNGSIVECGVLHGAGLLTWAKLSSIFEPANHVRKVIGFDTFEGFPSVDEKDTRTGTFHELKESGLTGSSYDNVAEAVRVYDLNRPIAHIPKVELVRGDLLETAPAYLEENPHLVVSMLYLDVDLYEPTKAAIEAFLPRMPKGALLVFDELNAKIFPGETLAVDEGIGLSNLRIQRFAFDSYVSYAVIE
jgi:hypothetical protein